VFPGAGNESRRWPLASFAALADQLTADGRARTAVFLGPEEEHLATEVRTRFPATTVIVDRLTVHQLVAALARLAVLVGNDTGPMHLAAAVGTPVVIVLDQRAPTQFVPRGAHVQAVNPAPLREIAVGDVVAATRRLLGARAAG
jgi:ADP-heptose:LPS heptosyltransferase